MSIYDISFNYCLMTEETAIGESLKTDKASPEKHSPFILTVETRARILSASGGADASVGYQTHLLVSDSRKKRAFHFRPQMTKCLQFKSHA